MFKVGLEVFFLYTTAENLEPSLWYPELRSITADAVIMELNGGVVISRR